MVQQKLIGPLMLVQICFVCCSSEETFTITNEKNRLWAVVCSFHYNLNLNGVKV